MIAAPRRPRAAEQLLARIEWHVTRRLDGLLQGDYRSLFLGHGLDLAEVREYQPGDDARYMDWNVTARMDAPHVRQYLEDREVTAWLLLDTSASLDFGTGRTLKRQQLVEVAGTLASLLTRRGNRAGAMCFSSQVDAVLPARGGRQQALAVVHQLLRRDVPSTGGPTDLVAAIQAAGRSIRRRSLIFLVSDFIAATGWEAHVGRLVQQHEVVAIWLRDRREEELPNVGPLVLEDAETGEQVRVDTGDRKFQARFRSLVHERRLRLEHAFAANGVSVLSIDTEADVLSELVNFASKRRTIGRRGYAPREHITSRAAVASGGRR